MDLNEPEAVCLTDKEWADFRDEFPGFDVIASRERWKLDTVIIVARAKPLLFSSYHWDQAMKYSTPSEY